MENEFFRKSNWISINLKIKHFRNFPDSTNESWKFENAPTFFTVDFLKSRISKNLQCMYNFTINSQQFQKHWKHLPQFFTPTPLTHYCELKQTLWSFLKDYVAVFQSDPCDSLSNHMKRSKPSDDCLGLDRRETSYGRLAHPHF